MVQTFLAAGARPSILNPEPQTLNPKTQNPKPKTQNPKPKTPNQVQRRGWAQKRGAFREWAGQGSAARLRNRRRGIVDFGIPESLDTLSGTFIRGNLFFFHWMAIKITTRILLYY